MSRPFLDVEDSRDGRRNVSIEGDVLRLGRLSSNDVQLLESHVSKQHAEIRRKGDRFIIADLESKAGVLVNGSRVDERALADGDVITFGIAQMPNIVFHSDEHSHSNRHPAPQMAMPAPPAEDSILETMTFDGEGGRLEKLARFLEFSRILGRAFSVTDVLDNVVDLSIEITHAERGFLILKSDGDELQYAVARGREKRTLPPEDSRASETIVRQVLRSGKRRMHSDLREDDELADQWSVDYFNLRSAVALPLRRIPLSPSADGKDEVVTSVRSEFPDGCEVFGVLYLDSQVEQSAFDQIDQDILESLAKDASSAIENARLLREAEASRRMQEEMERAREIQEALLPQTFWNEPHFEVAGSCVPSRQLGGDYLDQFRLPDGRCCLVIADVSGKGLPAALLAAGLQGALEAEAMREQPHGSMIGRVNRAVCRRAPLGKYVTFFSCMLSPEGELSYVNAGHVPPIAVLRASGAAEGGRLQKLFVGDMALGILESSEYRAGSLQLRPEDILVLYTDGVTEALGPDESMFEEARLEKVLERVRDRSAAEVLQAVTEAVREFTGDAPPADDITVMVLKYVETGQPGGEQ
jgi:serine phosphatase RsbU (regulator of sigma subunit)